MLSAMRMALGVTRKQAMLLKLLLDNDIVSVEMMEDKYGVATMARVLVYRIRSRLKSHGVTVKSTHGAGYWMSPEDKAKVLELISESSLGHGDVGEDNTSSTVAIVSPM